MAARRDGARVPVMEHAHWTFELPEVGASSEGLEEYEVRTADGEHLGTVAALVRRAGELLLVVEAGVLPPFVHRWLAFGFGAIAEIDHAACVVWLGVDRDDVDTAAVALDPHQARHGSGAEAVRVAEVPGGVPATVSGAAGPVAGGSFVIASAAAILTAFSLFAIVAVWMSRGLAGWEYAVFAIPAVLAALMVGVAGFALYRAPHVGHPAHPRRLHEAPPHPARRRSRFGGNAELVTFALGGALLYLCAALAFALILGEGLPVLGWVGFGVVATVVLGAATALAVFLVRAARAAGAETVRPRVSGVTGVHRVLVVADGGCAGADLCAALLAHVPDRRTEVLVVAPALVSGVRYLDSDLDLARADARSRLAVTVDALGAAGVAARGEVGSESPLEAIADALAVFPADEIVVATPPPERTNWLEQGVVERARALHGVPVAHLVVPQPEHVR
jgi:hypothetical protein